VTVAATDPEDEITSSRRPLAVACDNSVLALAISRLACSSQFAMLTTRKIFWKPPNKMLSLLRFVTKRSATIPFLAKNRLAAEFLISKWLYK
jgi:hypothetical protein